VKPLGVVLALTSVSVANVIPAILLLHRRLLVRAIVAFPRWRPSRWASRAALVAGYAVSIPAMAMLAALLLLFAVAERAPRS